MPGRMKNHTTNNLTTRGIRAFVTLCLISMFQMVTAQSFYTHAISESIESLTVYPINNPLKAPVVELNGEGVVIKFDNLLYGNSNYSYKIVHCNANWTPSDLASGEYVTGFESSNVDYGRESITTLTPYTHYELTIPNSDVELKLSGNYAVLIAEDYDFDHPVAIACFSVVEPLLQIVGNVTANTPLGISDRYQMLDFDIDNRNVTVNNPQREFNVVIMQNRRTDNMVINPMPTFSSISKLSYKNNRALVFEGGNEYRTVDFSSEYTYGSGIQSITAEKDAMHVQMEPALPRNMYATPTSGGDADGRMKINRQRSNDPDTEADYMWVHFFLQSNYIPNGSVHLLGDLTGNRLDALSYAKYVTLDNNISGYACSMLLKQGGYSYQFAFLPKGKTQATLLPTEGSYWATENEYIILVYHLPFGNRYDKLIGYQVIYSK